MLRIARGQDTPRLLSPERERLKAAPVIRMADALQRHTGRVCYEGASAAGSLATLIADVLDITGCSPQQAEAALWAALNQAEATNRETGGDHVG